MARRRVLTRAPSQPTGLSLDDPFVAGLGLIQLVYGGLNWDFAVERPLSSRGTMPVARAGSLEMVGNNAGTSRVALTSEKTPTYTIAVRVRMLSGNTNYCPLIGLMYDDVGSPPYGDQIDLENGGLRFANNSNGDAKGIVTGVGVSSVYFEWVFATYRPGYQAIYKNGVKLAEAYDNGGARYTAASVIGIGAINSDGRNPGCEIEVALRADHDLSIAEMNAIMANPYRLARNPRRSPLLRRFLAGPTYTFPLGVGSFSSVGNSARLAAGRRLAAAGASLSLTPTAVLLFAARRIVAAPGGLSLAGTAATLKVARRLPAASGVIALTGAAAKLTAARKLSAAPAAFVLTGGTATFVYTPNPGGQGPTYTLTGGSGAFLLTASAARLMLARRMVAAAGAFGATGMPAALTAARRLQATPGSFGLAGGAAGLRAGRRLAAGFGVFSASGIAARIATARRLPAATGSFAVAGTDALMKYSANRGEIDIDASTIPANRTVVFGAFSRVVVFGASSRVVVFGGATRVVVFDDPKLEKENSMANAEEPYFVDGKWFCDKDPDEKSYFVADISKELAKRHTTAVSVEVIVGGVTSTEGPDIQGSLIVVKLEGMDVTDGAENFWTARVTCANTEQFDRTTWLNKVDN